MIDLKFARELGSKRKAVLSHLLPLLVIGFVSSAILTPAYAQKVGDAAANKGRSGNATVLVKVNGYEITALHVLLARNELGNELRRVPKGQRYPFIINHLVERQLLAQGSIGEKTNESKDFRDRLTYYRDRALRDSYIQTKIVPEVTDEMLREVYEREKKKAEANPRRKARASQIVSASENDAKALHARLKAGEDFAELAKKHSTGEEAASGGDMGFFFPEEMVPNFATAVFNLKQGELSAPIQTQFGWHIVKLEEFQIEPVKPFEELKIGLKQIVVQQNVAKKINEFRDRSKIEFIDPDLIEFDRKVREEQAKRLQQQQKKQ